VLTATATKITINNIGSHKIDIEVPGGLSVLSDDLQPEKWQGCFRLLSQEDGDKRIVWRKESLAEINAAKQMFNDLVRQGMVPHRVGSDGRQSNEVMKEFDPTAEEVIFLPLTMARGG